MEMKELLLKEILPRVPEHIRNFYEPFLENGPLFLNVKADQYYLNAKDEELSGLYKVIKKRRQNFWLTLEAACEAWKKVEAHLFGVQDDLLKLAFQYNRRWKDNYCGFVGEVGDVLERIRYADLFGLTLPDPADFKMELRHQVLDAMVKIAETEPEDDVRVLLTAMKAAVYEFMSLLYEREGMETGVHLAAMVFVKELSIDGEFIGEEVIDRKPGSLLMQLHKDPAFMEKLDAAHIWRYEAPTFLKKVEITKEDFLFVRPPADYPMDALRAYLDQCPGRWMLVTEYKTQTRIEMNY